MRRPVTDRRRVIRDGVALGLAVGVFGLSFGALAVDAGLSVARTSVLSLAMFTGGSQLAYVGVLATGGSTAAAAVSAVLLGSRNAVYGVVVGPLLALPRRWRPVAAHLVIDETTAMTSAPRPVDPVRARRLARLAFLVTGLSVYVCWNVATLAGALAGRAVGDPDRFGLDAVGPAAFLALLWPRLRAPEPRTRLVALVGAVVGVLGALVLPAGLAVPVAALAVLAGGRPGAAAGHRDGGHRDGGADSDGGGGP